MPYVITCHAKDDAVAEPHWTQEKAYGVADQPTGAVAHDWWTPVKELRKVHVQAVAIVFTNRTLNLLDGSRSRALGAKSEARFAAVRIENRGEDI